MRPNFSKFFRLVILTLTFVLVAQIAHAQSKEKIEIKYKVDSVKVQDTYYYNVTIKVKNGNGPFTFYVFEGEPWKGGQVLKEAGNITEPYYKFEGLPRSSNYHVGVKGATKYDVNWMYVKP